jgi:poly(3-hydroxyalkanoate) synthetase
MVNPNDVFLWPAIMAQEWARVFQLASGHGSFTAGGAPGSADLPAHPEPEFASPNQVVLELALLTLRRFSSLGTAAPTLICAPYALHGATVADFAEGHSVVQALLESGVEGVHLAQWRSATQTMRFMTVDSLLGDLNVAVDDLGGRVNLVGLCQGGWLSVLFAARFPAKVARLVAVGSPLDVSGEASSLSANASSTPLSVFEQFVEDGDGLVLGADMLQRWASAGRSTGADEILMLPATTSIEFAEQLKERFDRWFNATMNLPGAYYLQVVEWLYKENRLAHGAMPALGRLAPLGAITAPVTLLAATNDELVPPAQMFASAVEFTSSPSRVTIEAPGPHLGLFMGRRTLAGFWPTIAKRLQEPIHSGRSKRRAGLAR